MCEEATNNFKLIGIWMSEKKFQKLRWSECVNVCRNHGYDLVKLDLDKPLEEQGPLRAFIHKLTDIIAAADQGDIKCREVIGNVEQYISNHPDMTVVDSLDNVRVLLDRYRYYSLMENQPQLRKHGVLTPPFCILTTSVHKEKVCLLETRGVTFPLVCKPLVAHGSKSAHSMCVVFNSAGLVHCRPPCVLQSFINHNAVLYKIFLVGNRYYVTERPSLKNFYACNEREPIYFHSGDVCKADSQSTLSILDPHDATGIEHKPELDLTKVEAIIKVLRKELQLVLFGVDIVIDNSTNHYAIIDINVYPGYEGFPNFFEHLVDSIDDMVNSREESVRGVVANGTPNRTEENIENNYGYNQEFSLTGFNRNNLINVGNTNLDSYCKNILKDVTDIFEG